MSGQVLVALRKGPVASLPDLRGRTLAVPGRHARTDGLQHLAGQGLHEERDYTALYLAEGAEEPDVEVLKAVLGGRADAGVLDAAIWQAVVADHRVPKGAFDVLWTTGGA